MEKTPVNVTTPIYTLQPLTGAALLAQLSTLDLSTLDHRDFASAISTVVSIAGGTAEEVVFDCETLNRLLYSAPPRVLGVSPARHGEVVSLLRRLLRLVGLHAPLEKGPGSLSPPWRALYDSLAPNRFRQMPLIDFMRFGSRSGFDPTAVTAETLSAFEYWCTTSKLEGDVSGKARRVASNWTWARANIPGWPDVELTRPSMREQYTFPLSAFDERFVASVKRFGEISACKTPGSIFTRTAASSKGVTLFTGHRSGRSRRRPLRPRTIETREQGIMFAAAALVHTGHPIGSLTSLADLVTPLERASAILTYHVERLQKRRFEEAELSGRHDLAARSSEIVQSAHLANIAEVLRQIACFHCDPPLAPDHIAQITEWAKRVTPEQQTTMTPKNRERLLRLIQPETRALLLHLPQELMRQAVETDKDGKAKLTPRAAATKALYALALEILLVCPMRRENLAKLRLDVHLIRDKARSRSFTNLQVDTAEVKNGRPIHWPLPESLTQMLQVFIDHHRPQLLDGTPNNHLFPGLRGKARNAAELGTTLSELVTREIGAEINVHLLRHFAAWNYLKKHPGAYEIIRLVLGHASVSTVIKFYAGLEADSAAQHFDDNLLNDRRETKAMASAVFQKRRGRPPGSKNKPKKGK